MSPTPAPYATVCPRAPGPCVQLAGPGAQPVYSEAASLTNTSMTSHSGHYVKMRQPAPSTSPC